MAETFKITLAQLNPLVGDLKGNCKKAHDAWLKGKNAGSDLVALPEMFISGYNPQDLITKKSFCVASYNTIVWLAKACAEGPALALGGPFEADGKLFNAYFVLQKGKIKSIIHKHHLPNKNVFDEVRIFSSGQISGPYSVGGIKIGSPICEDAWYEDVVETLSETGAEFLLVPNGSPYDREKRNERLNHMVSRVVESKLPLIYLNMVGGQDDQIFDGGSFVLNPGGNLVTQLPMFEECITQICLEKTLDGWQTKDSKMAPIPPAKEADYHAMLLGLQDYCSKNKFSKVLLGLSGGIDSALVAVLAADALGPENVRAVMLPSEYTKTSSINDAKNLAIKLGCKYDTIPITESRSAVDRTLAPFFEGLKNDLTEENIQSRLRAILLMAFSNKFGEMLLTTGNKSEIAVGYATIYGDMAGGYNPIKDLYKTAVFEMSKWRNSNFKGWMKGPRGKIIPNSIIEKEPSAELRPNQKDSDSLPDYKVLDGILQILVDQDGSLADCVSAGYNSNDISQVEELLYLSEYKRFQSAPGARLTSRAFGLDRRYPIVNRWREKDFKTGF